MRYLTPLTKSRLISCALIWIGVFLIMAIALGVIMPLIQSLSTVNRNSGLWIAALQNILLFIAPTLIAVRAINKHPVNALELNHSPEWRQIFGIIVAYIVGLPFLNQIVFWNANISLPESMASFEAYAKGMEQQAQQITSVLLDTTSFWGMLVGVLVIGILTGVGEEIVFRGLIQRGFEMILKKKWTAIWITALIFSAVHFQFYGFVPRALLGAFYGYLLVWTRNLWIPIIAHSINNSIVVVSGWLVRCNYISNFNPEQIGVSDKGISFVFIISFILLIFVLYKIRDEFLIQK